MYNQDFKLESPIRMAFIETQIVQVLKDTGELSADQIRILLIPKNTISPSLDEVSSALTIAMSRKIIRKINDNFVCI